MDTGQGTRGLWPRPHSPWGRLSPVPRRDSMTPFPEALPHFRRRGPIHTRGPRPSLGPLLWGRWPCHRGLCLPRPVWGASLWNLTREFGPALQQGLGWFLLETCSLRAGSPVPWGTSSSVLTATVLRRKGHRTLSEKQRWHMEGGVGQHLQPLNVHPQGCSMWLFLRDAIYS